MKLFTLFKTPIVCALIAAFLCFGLVAFPTPAETDASGTFFRNASVIDLNPASLDTFNSEVLDSANFQQLIITIDAIENAGTVTVDATIEMSADKTTWFSTGTTFTQLAATGNETKTITTGLFHRYIRVAVVFSAASDWDIDLYMTAKGAVFAP